MSTQIVTTRPASSSTAIAQRSTTVTPTAIVGLRADGGALVVMEAGGAEHRCSTALELWTLLFRLVRAKPEQVIVDESLKAKRQKLFDAFTVLGGKARDKLADRVGEDTVSAVETIGRQAVTSAVGVLRRTAVHGPSSLGMRAARETRKK